MRRLVIASLTALVALSGCTRPVQHRAVRRVAALHSDAKKAYHFQDGRIGYQGNDGTWFWLYMLATTNSQPRVIYTAPFTASSTISAAPSGTGWAAGSAPSQMQLAEAEEEDVVVSLNAQGMPETEAEAESAADSPSESAAEGASEGSSGGGESASGGGDGGGGGGGDSGGGGSSD